MDITIHIEKWVLFFVAGMVTSIVLRVLWQKFIEPGCIYLSKKIENYKPKQRYERVPKVMPLVDYEVCEGDFMEVNEDEHEECLSRKKKSTKRS